MYYYKEAVLFILLEVSEHLLVLIPKGSFRGFLLNTRFNYLAWDVDA